MLKYVKQINLEYDYYPRDISSSLDSNPLQDEYYNLEKQDYNHIPRRVQIVMFQHTQDLLNSE